MVMLSLADLSGRLLESRIVRGLDAIRYSFLYHTYIVVLCKLCALHTYVRIKLDDLVVLFYENSFADYKLLLPTDLLVQGLIF